MNARERPSRRPPVGSSDSRFEAVLGSAPLILTAVRLDGTIEIMAGQAMRALDRTPGSWIGRNFFDACRDHPDVLVAARRAMAGETVGPLETKLGDTIFESRFSPMHDARGTRVGITGVCIDVTARHRAETQLAHLHRLQTVGEMVTGIAHELNQPLTAIAHYADACELLLEDRRDLDLDRLASLIGDLGRQCQRAGGILRGLRDHVRKTTLHRAATRPGELIDEALRLHRTAWADATAVEVSAPADLPDVLVDAILIQQVLLNLLNNAAEAIVGETAPDAPRDAAHVEVRAERCGDDEVLIAVSDTGPGPGRCNRTQFFTPFFTTKPGGLGVGLSISRSIVEAHGGTLDAVVNEPRGMTFRFTLPRAV